MIINYRNHFIFVNQKVLDSITEGKRLSYCIFDGKYLQTSENFSKLPSKPERSDFWIICGEKD